MTRLEFGEIFFFQFHFISGWYVGTLHVSRCICMCVRARVSILINILNIIKQASCVQAAICGGKKAYVETKNNVNIMKYPSWTSARTQETMVGESLKISDLTQAGHLHRNNHHFSFFIITTDTVIVVCNNNSQANCHYY